MKISHLMLSIAAIGLVSTAASAQTAPANATYVNGANGSNTGSASATASATFSITGSVDQACVLGAGGDLADINFGKFGIYADASSTVENAFTSVGPRNGHTRTNLAGCNTSNSITITKTNGADGLKNEDADDAGYDSNQFQANIPYSVMARYTAGNKGVVAGAVIANQLTVGATQVSATREHGAWKSAPAFRIDITDPTKALVAGTYSDSVNVTLQAI